METRCPRCQATNPPQATWCNQCGTTFVPAAVGQPAQHQASWGAPPRAPSPPPPAPSWGPPGYAPPNHPPAPELASVWPRIGARILDALLVGFVMGFLREALFLPGGIGFNLVVLAALVVYETVLLTSGGRTVGKLLFGLQVVRKDRAPLRPGDALVRSAVIDTLGIIPFGWLLAALLLEKHHLRQGWHDQAAGTLVVTTRRHV
jgi:uncharacterized RDD family membrane protein YckC